MSTIRDEFEALMPEPVGRIYGYISGRARVEWLRRPGGNRDPLYTAEQMRAMFDAATERAAKQEREESEFLPVQKDGSVLTPEGYRLYPPSVASAPYGVIIKTLAGLLTAHRSDSQFDDDVQPSDPVRAAVVTIKIALSDIMKHVPKAAIRAKGGEAK